MTRTTRTARTVGRALVLGAALPFVVGVAAAPAVPPRGQVELTFRDPEIVESSGLVARDDLVLTVNDSGDTGRVFAVDRGTGETVGVTSWAAEPDDVEALAPVAGSDGAAGEVWVGDIGDNPQTRDTVTVLRVPVGVGYRDVEPASYELVYPDGPRDAETLMTDPATGRLVVVTKGIFGGEVYVSAPPDRLSPDRPNPVRRVGSALGIATDGAFWPDGRHLVVRGYADAVVYTWPALDEVATLGLPDQQQGEGVAVDPAGAVLLSSEGARSEVLRLRLPPRVAAAVAPEPEPTATATAAPDPATDPSLQQPLPERSAWPYVVGAGFGVVMLTLLVRSLRPRG
ncbi:WD40 repeat domain-containing protein [Nocardioides litoris]|uniref:WD40 repeat domain-containing protein n=1 Tax=Nocardioides litoris TaxID=1926648 RepID=UPI00111D661E|nr:WD40 repeat domain-containing protein [Nocardioides litoris]